MNKKGSAEAKLRLQVDNDSRHIMRSALRRTLSCR